MYRTSGKGNLFSNFHIIKKFISTGKINWRMQKRGLSYWVEFKKSSARKSKIYDSFTNNSSSVCNKFPASYIKPTGNCRIHETLPLEATRNQMDPGHSSTDCYLKIPTYSYGSKAIPPLRNFGPKCSAFPISTSVLRVPPCSPFLLSSFECHNI
jgi:hypothetical protein